MLVDALFIKHGSLPPDVRSDLKKEMDYSYIDFFWYEMNKKLKMTEKISKVRSLHCE